ncbi:TspO/MBR family protein [Aliidiomarina haloalkalitolerans]|uniref:Sensory protein n=1 Tax=Aliidiomarina haloalkalitolerans TaxID=859059 RepID=A0A432VVS0_9GAMM|nr:TspO/MBR family protein [Aliidiomarina haloalkalitolerans]RUO20682.1 sensory protein [Aliidiomarina haloalkalitolerans]
MTVNKTTSQQVLGLFAWLALLFVVAAVGSLGSLNAPNFYAELAVPSWAPPGWLFGPVWITLYTMMAIASWLVWREYGFSTVSKRAHQANFTQLALNMLWSWLFFAWYLGAVSFIEIIFLWLAIIVTIVQFWRLNRIAALLLVPYLAWVSFAAVLNFTIWQLNPGIL